MPLNLLAKSPTQVQGVVKWFFLFIGNLPTHHALTIHTIDLSVSPPRTPSCIRLCVFPMLFCSFLPQKQRHFCLPLALLTGSPCHLDTTLCMTFYALTWKEFLQSFLPLENNHTSSEFWHSLCVLHRNFLGWLSQLVNYTSPDSIA